jgi:Rrf2 family protein
MGVLFSRRCEYAFQAMLFVAMRPEGSRTSIKELTNRLDVPYHFMGKIFRDLVQRGLLVSHRGPHGGFALGVPAKEITLSRVVEALGEHPLTEGCVLGFPECSGSNPCAMHLAWEQARGAILGMMERRSLSDLAREMKKPGYH